MYIDCDSHIFPKDAFDYVPQQYSHLVPQPLFDNTGRLVDISFAGQAKRILGTTPLNANPATGGNRLMGNSEIDARLEDLDRMKISKQFLLPQFSGWWTYLIEPQLAATMAHSWNIAISKIVALHPDRFIGVALVAAQNVPSAIEELEWAVSSGFAAVTLDQTYPAVDHPFGGCIATNRDIWPIFEWCADHDFPVMFHFVPHGHKIVNNPRFLYDGLDFFALSEQRMNIVACITSGLLDEYPRLKLIQAETGVGYLERLADEIDRYYAGQSPSYEADEATPSALRTAASLIPGRSLSGLEQLASAEQMRAKQIHEPSSYFKRNFYWTIETEEVELYSAIERFGAGRFLFSTDYPHDDPGGRMKFRDVDNFEKLDLSDSDKSAIAHGNAEGLFNLAVHSE